MNLVAYDKCSNLIDKTKTWIEVYKRVLFSREINKRNYVAFGKRYNTEESITDYYIIIIDDAPTDRPYSKLKVDDFGRAKINVNSIWDESDFHNIEFNRNITLKHTEHTDDGDIYKIIF